MKYWLPLYRDEEVHIGNYSLRYIPRKVFTIRRASSKARRFSFYDISAFYKGYKLSSAGKAYLNMEKIPLNIDWDTITYERLMQKDILEYCLYDALICEKLAKLFVKTCQEMNCYTRNFASPASVSTHIFMKNRIPKINSIPKAFLQMATGSRSSPPS